MFKRCSRLLFLFAGGMKLVMPVEEMTKQIALPGLFLRFIAVCEVLGAIGLILPWLLHIRPGLTPIAAGLAIIMIGATVTALMTGGIAMALIPLVVGISRRLSPMAVGGSPGSVGCLTCQCSSLARSVHRGRQAGGWEFLRTGLVF